MSLEEAPTVLDVAQRTQSILEAEGLRVELTREDDRFIELSARAAFANSMGAELFVSVHSNSNGGTPASGTETFIANSASGTSVTMGGYLQEEMVAAWGLRDRGLKRANFTVPTSTRMPAALSEMAFTNRCDPDAALLRSPSSRMQMAQAHANAVLRTLDREPGMTTGTLTGVVFEDVGVGLEDTTRRLGGASVATSGMTQTSAPDTGAWSFALPPGTYRVTASLAGFRAAERDCDVTPGGTTWCSIGLAREAAPPADAGPPAVVDSGVVAPPDASSPPPADAGDVERPMAEGGCGCRVASRPSGLGGLAFVALALLALGRRRRRSGPRGGAPFLMALAALAVGCGTPATPEAAPLGEVAPAETVLGREIVVAQEVAAPLLTLGPARPVAEGLTAPVLSPDGTLLAVSNERLDELHLLDLERGTIEAVAQGPRVGYRPELAGRTLRYRHAQQSPTAVPHHEVALPRDVGGEARHGLRVRLDDAHHVWLRAPGGEERRVSPDGDRYLEPSISPDGRHVVFWGMATGLFLHRVADGALVELGAGSHPRFSADGAWLVFERTEDDGHVIVASDLHVVELATYRVAPLTQTEDRIERMPSMAGGLVAFATPEGVLVAPLR